MSLNLTPDGLTLLRAAISGDGEIRFLSIQLGNGADAGASAQALSNPVLTLPLLSVTIGDVFISLHTSFTNAEIQSGFRVTELGVIAQDGQDPPQILYAYGYTDDSEADYIPPASERGFEGVYDIEVYIGDAQNVTAAVSASMEYATKAEFDTFKARRDNPHQVTAEQVGLGNVANKEESLIAPTWNTVPETVSEPQSGETLRTLFGKLTAAVRALSGHLQSSSNPHGVTAGQVGAAERDHSHSASSIISGVLGPGRGGTGCNTLADAAIAFFCAALDGPAAKYSDLNQYKADGFYRVLGSESNAPLQKTGLLLVILEDVTVNNTTGTRIPNYRQIYICTEAPGAGEQKIYTRRVGATTTGWV